MVKLIANAFFFLEWSENAGSRATGELNLKYRVMLLLLTPYLVISSGLLANLYENVFLDLRQHGSDYFLGSTTSLALLFFTVVMAVAIVVLARSAWRMLGDFRKLYSDLGEFAALESRAGDDMSVIKSGFCWVVVCPFLVFGSFISLQYIPGYFKIDYFFRWEWPLVFFILVLLITAAVGYLLFRWGVQQGKRIWLQTVPALCLGVLLVHVLVQAIRPYYKLSVYLSGAGIYVLVINLLFILFGLACFLWMRSAPNPSK
jgi:hypothetical protein